MPSWRETRSQELIGLGSTLNSNFYGKNPFPTLWLRPTARLSFDPTFSCGQEAQITYLTHFIVPISLLLLHHGENYEEFGQAESEGKTTGR